MRVRSINFSRKFQRSYSAVPKVSQILRKDTNIVYPEHKRLVTTFPSLGCDYKKMHAHVVYKMVLVTNKDCALLYQK